MAEHERLMCLQCHRPLVVVHPLSAMAQSRSAESAVAVTASGRWGCMRSAYDWNRAVFVVGSQKGLAGPNRACSWSANATASSPSLRA
jgi:hypothetical protein